MKVILASLLLAVSITGHAWQAGTSVRTSDGDMIEAGSEVAKLSKLQGVKRAGSDSMMYHGAWVSATFYEYNTYEANYRFTVIGGRITKVEWQR